MGRASLCLLLAGCGPVLLGEEQRAADAGARDDAGSEPGTSTAGDGASPPSGVGTPDAGPPPVALVRIQSLDCGKCFELQAEGSGGLPPYGFEWEDGSRLAQRRVCVDGADVALAVVAVDAQDVRSAPQTIRLAVSVDAECPPPVVPTDAGPPPQLCLQNLSFEGTPVFNMGQAQGFDADPWNDCTNPMRDNTPDIGNDTVAVTPDVPAPADGLTFLGLAEGEQVSQALCSEAPAVPVSFELHLARIDISGGLATESERVFLEIWGGLSADCSQGERLWTSPDLQAGWERFCVTLRPRLLMTQLTLRANTDMASLNPGFLLVDNMRPVDRCP